MFAGGLTTIRTTRWVRFGAVALLMAGFVLCSITRLQAGASSPGSTPDLGIDVLLYPSYGTTAQDMSAAQRVFSYVSSLGANSVALSFFFYQTSVTASSVEAGVETPSVSLLGSMVDLAHADGLRVQLRPLLNSVILQDEGSSREKIAPKNVSAWFASYLAFLKPYMVMARLHHVEEFAVSAELASLAKYDDYYTSIVDAVHQTTRASVIYESNWNPESSVPNARSGIDLYEPILGITSNADATTAAFTAGMKANLQNLQANNYGALQAPPSETVLAEVGIAAIEGSWRTPWVYPSPPDNAIDRALQADWFTAACNVVQDLNMRGLYFWYVPLDAGFEPTYNANTSEDPVQWENTSAAAAISSCFARSW